MGCFFSRKTQLINETDEVLEFWVHREGAVFPDLEFSLQPRKHKNIRGTRYRDAEDASGRMRRIEVRRQDGEDCRFNADEFIWNIRFIFRINNNKLDCNKLKSDRMTNFIRMFPPMFWPRKLRENVRSGPTGESNERRDVDDPTREPNERRDVDERTREPTERRDVDDS